MRKGTVIAFNNKIRQGIIKDYNNQRLKFYIEDGRKIFKRFDQVKFDISFRNGSLCAINIVSILDGKGKPVNLNITSK